MMWILAAAGLCLAGLVVLGVAGARVVVAARGLNREIARVHQQFRSKADLRG
ncbi:hypothetical protein SAMN05444920_122158 [Nonomuraea solani]|uniref:Uncharacterized protein n=1 Tax=Nonomuraea solani TaxID=1144553 RepID=A0A1H6EVM8_9ACTN|nr:hypothetical protein [Nonomuraea solani]SEH01907.1 hypothetical protein SAMN05444920_122158 [Nonomuraea solani]